MIYYRTHMMTSVRIALQIMIYLLTQRVEAAMYCVIGAAPCSNNVTNLLWCFTPERVEPGDEATLVQQHTKTIVHFMKKAPKLVYM